MLAQRCINVHGCRNIGPTYAQCQCFGWDMTLTDSFCFGICNTQWEVLLSKQVNYNQVVVKCQILQECFLQNFNMKKFHNMEHSNSRTFKGLEFFSPNSRTFKDFSRTL